MKKEILIFLIFTCHVLGMTAQNLPSSKRKFVPKVKFEDYTVDTYEGTRVKPSNAKYFSDRKRNALKQAWKRGEINFAGHFYLEIGRASCRERVLMPV